MIQDVHGLILTAKIYLRLLRMVVHPPIGKHPRYSATSLRIINVDEDEATEGPEQIRLKMLTDLPVENLAREIEKLELYA